MTDPYWIKSAGAGGGMGAPYYSLPPPPQQQHHQMSQHQVPQQHPQQLAQQLPQQQPPQQQYQNMSWNRVPPKAAPADAWGSWHNQAQPPPPTNHAAQNYQSYNYAQQPQHQPPQPQSGDHWNWSAEETPQAALQQPVLNNNINQSFQNDSSWNWSVDQSAPQQNSVNYYQMGYSDQHNYTEQNVGVQSQLPANNNQAYPEVNVAQPTLQSSQDFASATQFNEQIKVDGEDELKTEQPVEATERYDEQPEPAMSETSKHSMTPQWSIESQVSQDSDDISSSIGHTGGFSPASISQAKSEDSGQRHYAYGSTGDVQNLWEDTEDDDDLTDKNTFLEQSLETNPSLDQIDRHNKLNLDETISALESLNVTSDNLEASLPPPPRAGSVSSDSIAPSGPPPSGPSPSGPPPSGPPPSGPPPSGPPPPSKMGMSSGSNPYSVNRSGLSHKSTNKLFPNSSMTRQAFPPPLQPSAQPEVIQPSQENLANSLMVDSQPGMVDNRSIEPPAGHEFGRPADVNSQASASWAPQESHEAAPRFGLDRNQYLETGQLTSQTSEEESAPPPGLHRLVTGQLTEQDSQAEVSTPPPGLDRMIPGQITERDEMRMVPGRMMEDDDDVEDDADNNLLGGSRNTSRSSSRDQGSEHASNLRRMIPGQTDSQEEEDELPNISIGPGDLPPGLHRMVPGESSSPESQANNSGGIASSTNTSAFQPIEPRVVTGDSMESMPQPVVAPPPQQSIKAEPGSPAPDHSAIESRSSGNPQPTSERSETIGSDGVDEKASDNTMKKSDRRSRDDVDDEDRDEREPRSRDRDRDYYRRDREDDRDRSMSPTDSGSNRYRDDRDRERDRERDRRYDSPEGRSRYRDRRARDKEADYDSDRRYESRQGRDHRDHRSAKRDGPADKARRGLNREDDEGDSDDYGSERDSRKWTRDRDVERDRDRVRDFDRTRDRDADRHRDRHRDGYRDRGDRSYGEEYYRRGERRGRDEADKGRRSGGRRPDDYQRGYDEDYYRRSSRPSSRSGSVHEYGHGYEREYRDERLDRASDRHGKQGQQGHQGQYNYPGYYYNPQDYYRYQMYYANLRKTDPEAYAAWYRKYYSQYAASQPGTYEDRGSVHSGRSSANEELSNQRFERHRSPNRSQNHYQKSPQTSSSNRYQSTDNASPFSRESGRGVGHGESSLDETNSSIQRLTPFKFSTAHIKGIITRRGHLLKVLPHYPLDGQSATVEIHSMQTLIPGDPSLQELLALPGPLVRGVTHKKTIILYLRSKMESTRNDPAVYDRQSVILLYELLILLLRQNGMIVGTDIAELLMRNGDSSEADDSWSASGGADHRAQSTPSPAPSGGSRTSSASATPAVQMSSSFIQQTKLSESEITNKFREFLLYGNTKEALEWAMKHGLWGHALFLSSKLDQRMYHSVMTRFANGLALTDPIQTLYQLLSGWQPAAVTCVADDKWGDWRPHLAMILSNTSSRPEIDHKAIMTLGDTLGARGCLHAAHFCYLMAQHPFGTYSQRSSKYVLLGSSHLRSFAEFATNEAIMITSIYEYARALADPNFHIPNLQPYKYLMATRLVEAHLLPEAVHYCEIVSRLIVQNPQQYDAGFIHDIAELGESLKFHDPFYAAGGDLNSQGDPDWLLQIRSVSTDYSAGTSLLSTTNYGDSFLNTTYNMAQGDTLAEQISISSHSMDPSSYSQEVSQVPMFSIDHSQQDQQVQPQQMQQLQQPPLQQEQHQSVTQPEQIQQPFYYQDQQQQQQPQLQQQPWGHQEGQAEPSSYSTEGYGQVDPNQSGWWSGQQQEEMPSISTDVNAPVTQGHSNLEPLQQPPQQIQPKATPPTPAAQVTRLTGSASTKTANQPPAASASTQSNSSWFGGLWNKLSLRPKNQMKLPDDKNPSIVWDDQKKRWVSTDADGEEVGGNVAPPPKMSEMPGRFASPGLTSSTPNVPTHAPGMANGSAGMAFSTPVSSVLPPQPQPQPQATEGDTPTPAAKPPAGPNMFKMQRGRSLKASYVDVMNPNGTKPSAPSGLPPPSLFPTSTSQPSSLNYFVPAAVEGNDNAPTDFLTPAAAPIDSLPEQQPLSRWSSSSSLSREVQSYTTKRPPSRNQVQAGLGGPQMFNPSQFSQQPQPGTGAANRKRYVNS